MSRIGGCDRDHAVIIIIIIIPPWSAIALAPEGPRRLPRLPLFIGGVLPHLRRRNDEDCDSLHGPLRTKEAGPALAPPTAEGPMAAAAALLHWRIEEDNAGLEPS